MNTGIRQTSASSFHLRATVPPQPHRTVSGATQDNVYVARGTEQLLSKYYPQLKTKPNVPGQQFPAPFTSLQHKISTSLLPVKSTGQSVLERNRHLSIIFSGLPAPCTEPGTQLLAANVCKKSEGNNGKKSPLVVGG